MLFMNNVFFVFVVSGYLFLILMERLFLYREFDDGCYLFLVYIVYKIIEEVFVVFIVLFVVIVILYNVVGL